MTLLTVSGLPVHPSHETARAALGAGFPDETCHACGGWMGHPDETPDRMADECDGWAGDDPSESLPR